jgi:DNA-binding transcriptional MerR regulator
MGQPEDAPAAGEYTIDELAARTSVPSRTIRFYQAKGVLPPPRKRGRVAVYDDDHARRLQLVGELQDKGLRLRAIRDIVARQDLDGPAIQKWLGIGKQLGSLSSDDAPRLLTEEELRKELGNPPAGAISRLVRKGVIQTQGEGADLRYLVESPALLGLGQRLWAAGVDLDTGIMLRAILQRRFASAAREVVDFAIKHVGRGFGRSSAPEDVTATLETLFQGGVGAEAVRLIFAKELQKALQSALQLDANVLSRKHGRPR